MLNSDPSWLIFRHLSHSKSDCNWWKFTSPFSSELKRLNIWKSGSTPNSLLDCHFPTLSNCSGGHFVIFIRWPTSSEVNVTMYLTDPWGNGNWPWGKKGSWWNEDLHGNSPENNVAWAAWNWAFLGETIGGRKFESRLNGSSIWWSFDQKISDFPLSNSSNCHKLWVSLVSPGFLRNPIWTTSIRNVQVSHWTCDYSPLTDQIRSISSQKILIDPDILIFFYSNQIYNHILIYPHYLYHISAIS